LWIGGTRNPVFAGLEAEYIQRIQRFTPVTVVTVPESKKVDPRKRSAQMEKEAESLNKRIGSNSYLVSLDERGKGFTSESFAGFVESLMNRGGTELIFLGGGHMGIPGALLERSDLRLSLSRFTLPHEMARIVLLEQVYRSFSIIRGLPYHR
jgi:23S rRNA (pseudouridine1915-N3)-methyltransferase